MQQKQTDPSTALLCANRTPSGWLAAWLAVPALMLTMAIVGGPGAPGGPLVAQAVQDAEPEKEETEEERRERMKRLAEERRKAAEAEREKAAVVAVEAYDKMARAYLDGEMDQIAELNKEMRRHTRYLSREQREAVKHMARKAPEYRPKWWKGTKKEEENSFKAEIWGFDFWANYVPTKELGLQAVFPKEEFNRRTGEMEIVDLIVLVTWKPLMVDSPKPAEGRLAREHGYTLGDIAEIIVWHELGHNYITESATTAQNIDAYQNHGKLYSKLHEYFADMTAIYHSKPKGRRIALQFRLDGLDYYMPDQEHCRGSHGIGSIVIADMLANPDAWPSVHFPPAVPEQQVEVNTIIYIYENLSPEFTVEEDMRLQQLAYDYIKKQGVKTFKTRGELTLPNKLKYRFTFSEDRENQEQRDKWVADKLKELISEGRADKLEEGETYEPPERTHTRRDRFTIRFDNDGEDDENAPKRIEIPWDQ